VTRTYAAFKAALGQRESSNNYQAKNRYGYLGRYQFGKVRLCDLGLCMQMTRMRIEWLHGLTEQAFLDCPMLQDLVFDLHVAKLRAHVHWKFTLEEKSLTMSGAIAVMHLVGPGGLVGLLKGINFTDGNGVQASEYLRLFRGYQIPDTHPGQISLNAAIAMALKKEIHS